ncbi:TonB C-terminal domain-containing protein, partial [Kosakonia radicincitans]
SGNEAWDQAVVGAVERAAPLPPDNNGQTPPNIRITFHASDAG